MSTTKKALITGGTGFLGVHVARKFFKEKWQVTLFDKMPLDAKDLAGKVNVIIGDITDAQAMTKAIKNHEYVVHAAAALPIQQDKETIYHINIDGTKNVLAASLKNNVKRLIFISSTAVYGVPKHLPETEESPLDPIGYYGESKIRGEQLCQEYMHKGLAINIFRPKTFLGIERLGVFSLWYEAIYTNRRVYVLGNGKNKYQLLAVSDLADVIVKALTSPVKNEIFNIGAKEFGTWQSDLGYVIKQAHSKSHITGLPTRPSQLILSAFELFNLSPIAAWHYKTMPVDSYVSIAKAEKLLHWHPKKSNKQLFWESYDWYRTNRKNIIGRQGKTHRVNWDFKILNVLNRF